SVGEVEPTAVAAARDVPLGRRRRYEAALVAALGLEGVELALGGLGDDSALGGEDLAPADRDVPGEREVAPGGRRVDLLEVRIGAGVAARGQCGGRNHAGADGQDSAAGGGLAHLFLLLGPGPGAG